MSYDPTHVLGRPLNPLELTLLGEQPNHFRATTPTYVANDDEAREWLAALRVGDFINGIRGQFRGLLGLGDLVDGEALLRRYVAAENFGIQVVDVDSPKAPVASDQPPSHEILKVRLMGGFVDVRREELALA